MKWQGRWKYGTSQFGKTAVLAKYLAKCKTKEDALKVIQLIMGPRSNRFNSRVSENKGKWIVTIDILRNRTIKGVFSLEGVLESLQALAEE